MPKRPRQSLMTSFPDNDGYDIHRPSEFLPSETDPTVRAMVVELEKIVDVALKIRVPLSGGLAHLVLLLEMLQSQKTEDSQIQLAQFLLRLSWLPELTSERFLDNFKRFAELLSYHDAGTPHPDDTQTEPTAPRH
jgi:hypothetical protein